MGAWFEIVNPTKRQYLDINGFGENFKWSGLVTSHHGRSIHAMAVAWLCCRFQGQNPDSRDDLNGTWSGDIIYFASDEALPDLDGVTTSTPGEPDRNLAGLAHQEYEDITSRVIRDLCEKDKEIARILVERVQQSSADQGHCWLLHELGRIATHLGCGEIESALEARFGEDWRRLFEKAEAFFSDFPSGSESS